MDAEDIQKMQEEYRKQVQAQALNEKARKEKEETLSKKDERVRQEAFRVQRGNRQEEG